MMMKKICSLLLCGVLALNLCGCGKNPSNSQDSTKELTEIDVVLDWYPNAVHAFIYEAIAKGYYEEEGLKVNIRFPSNENDALSLVAAGQAEIGVYYMQDLITTKTNQDVPITSIGSIVQAPLNIILSLKDKNITSPKDLEGKTIGYAGTELSGAIVKSMMEASNVPFDDNNLINVGFDLMASMTTGQVDATIGCYINHEVPQMEEEGFEVNYFNVTDYGVPNYYELVFLANDSTIENNPELLKAFLRASKKGFDNMAANPEAALETLLNNQNEENFPLSATVETQSMNALLPLMATEDSPFLSQDTKVWDESIQWLYDQGLIEEKLDVSQVMTTDLLSE